MEMRRKDREVKDPAVIREILNKARVLHLGLFDEGYPYIVPLHYGYEMDEEGKLTFYMHGAREGHKLDLIKSNPKVCVELECDVELVSGGDNPCKYGSAYASVIGRGLAEIVTDENEKIKGLTLLMKNQTGRDFTFDSHMAAAVEVIRITVAEYTAKSRAKAPQI